MARNSGFTFDGDAGTNIGTAIITTSTPGICYQVTFVLNERWRAKHSYIHGRQLVFTGTATGLFGLWIRWFLLSVVTLGIYASWVAPRLYAWKWEHTAFADSGAPQFVPIARAVPIHQADDRFKARPPHGAAGFEAVKSRLLCH